MASTADPKRPRESHISRNVISEVLDLFHSSYNEGEINRRLEKFAR
jgi:hypothetical protein